MVKNYVLTSDKGNWLLGGFIHQWQKYCGLDVTIAGFSKPDIELPKGFDFISLGNFEDYPADKWSNALFQLLKQEKGEILSIFLEDYWLTRQVNMGVFDIAEKVFENDSNTVRFDLCSDRQYAEAVDEVESVGWFDIIKAKPECSYQLSFQASMWSKTKLLSLLLKDESPWEVELLGTERLREKGYNVYGTRQWPVKYHIMVKKGKFEIDGSWMFPPRQLKESDLFSIFSDYPDIAKNVLEGKDDLEQIRDRN